MFWHLFVDSLLNAEVVETKFKDQLMEFIEQEETVEMPFPSTLNANVRRIIHEASLNYHSCASLVQLCHVLQQVRLQFPNM